MRLARLPIFSFLILIGIISGCSKKPGGESEKIIPDPIHFSHTNRPDTTTIQFPEGASTCLKFFSLLEAGERKYIVERNADIQKTLQNIVRNFAKNKLQKDYGVDTGGIEEHEIDKNDCSVFTGLASKIKDNQKIMDVYRESSDEFNPLEYIFDQILYFYFDTFDLVSSYEGRYTSEFFYSMPSLKSGLRMMVKADYYRNWARKVDGKEISERNPKYLVVEYSPEYLQEMLPRNSRIYKINGKPVEKEKYVSSLSELDKLEEAELTVRLWDETNEKYTDETTIEVTFENDTNRARQITYNIKNGIAYMQIPTFSQEDLDKDFYRAWIDEIKRKKAEHDNTEIKGTIIDLRNNGGGRAYEAAKILGMILPRNSVISHYIERDASQNRYKLESHTVQEHYAMNFGKIIVLTNFKSASASEVVSAAIQDYGAGLIVGEKTIGKGIGQDTIPIKEPYIYGEVAITNFYVFSPAGNSWYMTGVIPDIEVSEPSQQNYIWNFADVSKNLPAAYTNKPNVTFNRNINIPNKVTPEIINQLRIFRNDPKNEPAVCKKSVSEMAEEDSCILSWGESILNQWIQLNPTI